MMMRRRINSKVHTSLLACKITNTIYVKHTKFPFSYDKNSGARHSSTAEIKRFPIEVVILSGKYSYADSQGTKAFVNYEADEKGYHPRVRILDRARAAKIKNVVPEAGIHLIKSLVGGK